MPPGPPSARSLLKPNALFPGDTIMVIAPASDIKPDLLASGCKTLEQLGYRVAYSPDVASKDLYFAGSLERRVKELHEAFRDPEVKAIFCARGGYGANYLLPHLDLELIRSNPKIFCGYSDLTSLLTYLHDQAGLIVFHGPMVTKDFALTAGFDQASLTNALCGMDRWKIVQSPAVQVLREGEAEGKLYGGCLSMLTASLGTPYEILTEGTILFIEDIATKPYQVDRMLMQLKLAGKLESVRGVIFGEMIDCVQDPKQSYTLQEIVMRVLDDYDFPVGYGLRSGHVSGGNITLPLGVRAHLSVSDRVALETQESATVARAQRATSTRAAKAPANKAGNR